MYTILFESRCFVFIRQATAQCDTTDTMTTKVRVILELELSEEYAVETETRFEEMRNHVCHRFSLPKDVVEDIQVIVPAAEPEPTAEPEQLTDVQIRELVMTTLELSQHIIVSSGNRSREHVMNMIKIAGDHIIKAATTEFTTPAAETEENAESSVDTDTLPNPAAVVDGEYILDVTFESMDFEPAQKETVRTTVEAEVYNEYAADEEAECEMSGWIESHCQHFTLNWDGIDMHQSWKIVVP
eukprot:SAG11_NODE_7638_length_1117_cov_93.008841_1_plen_242_part_00